MEQLADMFDAFYHFPGDDTCQTWKNGKRGKDYTTTTEICSCPAMKYEKMCKHRKMLNAEFQPEGEEFEVAVAIIAEVRKRMGQGGAEVPHIGSKLSFMHLHATQETGAMSVGVKGKFAVIIHS